MQLYYYHDPAGNFGDDLNPWLWSQVVPELFDEDEDSLFVGIGTILNDALPKKPTKWVFGSGVGYGNPPTVDESWRVYCVRGPLTAQALGLDPALALTDSALLVNQVAQRLAPTHRLSLMPHRGTLDYAKARGIDIGRVCRDEGIHYIDPGAGVETVLQDIRQSATVLADAMHGAIVADSLRVPWVPLQLAKHILPFKWLDWCRSLELEYEPMCCTPLVEAATPAQFAAFLASLRRCHKPRLSRESVSRRATERMLERLAALRDAYGASRTTTVPQRRRDTSSTPAERLAAIQPYVYRKHTWQHRKEAVLRELSALPVGATCVLMDEGQFGTGLGIDRRIIPFPERQGQYWGPPADAAAAIAELQRLKNVARYLVIAWPAFWWLEHYTAFHEYLRAHCRCVKRTEDFICYDLA